MIKILIYIYIYIIYIYIHIYIMKYEFLEFLENPKYLISNYYILLHILYCDPIIYETLITYQQIFKNFFACFLKA